MYLLYHPVFSLKCLSQLSHCNFSTLWINSLSVSHSTSLSSNLILYSLLSCHFRTLLSFNFRVLVSLTFSLYSLFPLSLNFSLYYLSRFSSISLKFSFLTPFFLSTFSLCFSLYFSLNFLNLHWPSISLLIYFLYAFFCLYFHSSFWPYFLSPISLSTYLSILSFHFLIVICHSISSCFFFFHSVGFHFLYLLF